MKVDSAPDGTLRIHERGSILAPLGLLLLCLLIAAFTVDVFSFSCTRANNRCDYRSISLVGVASGSLDLDAIDYLDDQSRQAKGAQVNEVYTRVQHAARLRDGTTVPLEYWSRGSMVGTESLPPRFNAFRNSTSATLWVPEIHFGMGGIFVLTAMVFGLVFLVLYKSVWLEIDPTASSLKFTRRGIIGGFRSWSGDLKALQAVELNRQSYAGVFLRVADVGLLKLTYGGVDATVADAVANAAGVEVNEITNHEVTQSASGTNPLPAIGCMLAAFAPLSIPCFWGIGSALVNG